jgi:hypothetical protein
VHPAKDLSYFSSYFYSSFIHQTYKPKIKELNNTFNMLCQKCGSELLASRHGSPGSVQKKSIWDLRWMLWLWGRICFSNKVFPIILPMLPLPSGACTVSPYEAEILKDSISIHSYQLLPTVLSPPHFNVIHGLYSPWIKSLQSHHSPKIF